MFICTRKLTIITQHGMTYLTTQFSIDQSSSSPNSETSQNIDKVCHFINRFSLESRSGLFCRAESKAISGILAQKRSIYVYNTNIKKGLFHFLCLVALATSRSVAHPQVQGQVHCCCKVKY